jgi:hypothetical protein
MTEAFIIIIIIIILCEFGNHVPGDEEHFPEERNCQLHFETMLPSATFNKNFKQTFIQRVYVVQLVATVELHSKYFFFENDV